MYLTSTCPDCDGFSLCQRLREAGDDVPVIFLTARDDPADLRRGFTGGGDDYLTKPFSLEELVLRVEAVLRRGRGRSPDRSKLAVADVVLDDDAHRVWRGEKEVELSPTEYRLLRYLMINAGRVLSRTQIIEHVGILATPSSRREWKRTSATCGENSTIEKPASSTPCAVLAIRCVTRLRLIRIHRNEYEHTHCARGRHGSSRDAPDSRGSDGPCHGHLMRRGDILAASDFVASPRFTHHHS